MEYIIMAGGQATRWNNYQNTSKHLVKIDEENLLERIVRQLKDNNIHNISISSNNPLYQIEGTKLNKLIYDNRVYNMFYYDALDHEVTFLYGDTFYEDSVINKIVNAETDDILFFGTKESIVGIKVVNCLKFKKYVEGMRDYKNGKVGWAIYREINNNKYKNYKIDNNFVTIKDEEIVNVNEPEDYKKLVRKYQH